MSRLIERLLADDSGQDIVEYALLTALIGIAGLLVWNQLATLIGAVYGQTDTDVQNLYAPPNPGGS
jgi:Flp pilus assembly pilin Flp